MNNQDDLFYQHNGDLIQQLKDSLLTLLMKFERGIVPGEPEKSDALYFLNSYLDALVKYKRIIPPAFEIVSDEQEIRFNERTVIKEIASDKSSIELLLKMRREKMLLTTEPIFSTDGGKNLLNGKYCTEVIAGVEDSHYYILSPKGQETIKNKSIISAIREKINGAVFPVSLSPDSSKWSNLYVKRVEMINRYYRVNRGGLEHIIFSLNESIELVFGCEINDVEEINYVFAGIFDEKIEEHISFIKSIVNSGRIDSLTILYSSKEGKELMEDNGLTEKKYRQLKFELLM